MKELNESEKLIEAMVQAFDNQSLDRMLKLHLNKAIVDWTPQKELVTSVVERAAAEGWTEDLIKAALIEQADSQAIKRAAVFEPLKTLYQGRKKSPSTTGEVARVVSSLLKVLNQASPQDIKPETFTELNSHLTDLYGEYARLSEGIKAS